MQKQLSERLVKYLAAISSAPRERCSGQRQHHRKNIPACNMAQSFKQIRKKTAAK
jgi:hypothetical protein